MNTERVKAIATIVITAVVNIINLYGYAVDAGAIVNAVFTVVSFACILWAWWKNQNVTFAAQQGQMVVDRIKNEQRALRMSERHRNA